jgi:hypothetical protein
VKKEFTYPPYSVGRDNGIGRCKPCAVAFKWPQGKPKLRNALCPYCNQPLSQTTMLLRGVRLDEGVTPKEIT